MLAKKMVRFACDARKDIPKMLATSADFPSCESSYWPDDLLGAISEAVNAPSPQPAQTEFMFQLDQEPAPKNFCILSKHGKDLSMAIESQLESPPNYGSEFCPTSPLASVFGKYPN